MLFATTTQIVTSATLSMSSENYKSTIYIACGNYEKHKQKRSCIKKVAWPSIQTLPQVILFPHVCCESYTLTNHVKSTRRSLKPGYKGYIC